MKKPPASNKSKEEKQEASLKGLWSAKETTQFTERMKFSLFTQEPTGSYFRHNFNKLRDLVSQPTTDEMQPTGKRLGVVLLEANTQSIKIKAQDL